MTSLRKWQILGAIGIVLAYVCFVVASKQPAWAWGGWGLLIGVGIVELVVIFGYHNTITRFWRNMYGKMADKIILIVLVVVTWWLAGELAAGFFLLGLLNSHFHEHEF